MKGRRGPVFAAFAAAAGVGPPALPAPGPGARPGSCCQPRLWRQHLAALLANQLNLISGLAVGWTAPAIPVLLGRTPHAPPVELSPEQAGWLAAAVYAGAICGALPSGPLAGRLGRKAALLAGAAPMLAGWLMLALATQPWHLFAGRLLTGLAWGATNGPASLYCEEIAEVAVRGALGTYCQLLLSLGLLLMYTLGELAHYAVYNVVCCCLPVLFVLTFCWMPESPVFLVSRGRLDAARSALVWLGNRGPGHDPQPELDAILSSGRSQKQMATGWSGCWRAAPDRATVRAVAVVWTLVLVQKANGSSAIMNYMFKVFKDAGSSLSAGASSMVAAGVSAVAAGASALMVDRLGRRPLLLGSGLAMGIALTALAAYSAAGAGAGWRWLPLAAVTMYVMASTGVFVPVTWLLMAELLPLRAKGWASSTAVAINRVAALVVSQQFPGMVASLGPASTYALFAAVCVAGVAFSALCVPETAHRTRDEIQANLGGRTSVQTTRC